MVVRLGRRLILGGSTVVWLAGDVAWSQTQLPEIVVTTPSPIVRRAPAQPDGPATVVPVTPAAEPALQGTLPIVTDQFATVTVIPGDEVQRSSANNIGDVLFTRPGMTSSTFAPGASRPIIRGLDNYRVRVQENGIGVNDVSEFAEDHAVPIDPLSAQRMEVVRGPATLRWGSQAIGGVVNVDNNRIPTAIPFGGYGFTMLGAGQTVDSGKEGAAALDVGKGNVAFHADVFGRKADDYAIPGYPYLFPPDPAPLVFGRQPNSAMRSDGQAAGGSYIFDQGFFGVAVSQFNSLYRIPGIEATETNTRIDLHQTKVTSKGEFRPLGSPLEAVRFWGGVSDYKHDELANEGGFDGIQQSFTNKSQESRVEVQLTPFDLRFAALTTAFGVQASNQELTSPGVEGGLFDPNRTTAVAGFLFNELRFTDTLRAQVAGRIENVSVAGSSPDFPVDLVPDGSELAGIQRSRDFTPMSAAAGLLKDLPFGLVGSITAQYVERAPRAPELFSRGVHEATGTFDIGNPNLTIESARTVEVGLRRGVGPLRFEATAYYTRFAGFIFRRLTGVRCGEDFDSCGVEDELAQAVYTQREGRGRLLRRRQPIRHRPRHLRGRHQRAAHSPAAPRRRRVLARCALVRARRAAARVRARRRRPQRDADRRLRSAQGRGELHQAAEARRLRPAGVHAGRRRQQPARRRRSQLRLVQEGRGLVARPQRALLRQRAVLIRAARGAGIGHSGMGMLEQLTTPSVCCYILQHEDRDAAGRDARRGEAAGARGVQGEEAGLAHQLRHAGASVPSHDGEAMGVGPRAHRGRAADDSGGGAPRRPRREGGAW
jgi:iron complex outermembrane receptor protein